MQTVLNSLITVPGVVGGMVCDTEGAVLSTAFPPIFDGAILGDAARVLVDGAVGLESVTGKVGMVDLRYGDARILVRPLPGAHLVLLCAAQTNLQLLNISTSVAIPKLEKLVAALPPPEPVEVVEMAPPPPPPPAKQKEAAAPAKKKEKQEKAEPEEDPGFFHW
jgi:predicted regulator of Ras-like GTPase activity (Roadblock/LC7/MglB family)